MASSRKTPKSWIEAGLDALKQSGPDGLRAETLARALGTTKGSFYWHFKDVPAFQRAVLDEWQSQADTRFRAALDRGDTTVARLRALAKLRQTPLDLAVRGWAVQDPTARRSVSALDKAMLSEISHLLDDLGATHPDFPGLILAALVGTPRSGSHTETLIDLLLVLK